MTRVQEESYKQDQSQVLPFLTSLTSGSHDIPLAHTTSRHKTEVLSFKKGSIQKTQSESEGVHKHFIKGSSKKEVPQQSSSFELDEHQRQACDRYIHKVLENRLWYAHQIFVELLQQPIMTSIM